MTLPSSGSLDFNTIRAEFGSPSSNVALNLYYRGGSYVYSVPANSSIPASGQVSVSNFYGAKGKGDYASAPFGYYTSGGKVPTTNGGASNSNSNIPNFSDTSILIGGVYGTITENKTESSFLASFTFGPFASNVPLLNRNIYYYNTSSGALTHQWYTWPPATGATTSWGNTSASYPANYFVGVMPPNPGQPANAQQFTGGPQTGQSLTSGTKWGQPAQTVAIKAF